MRIPGGSVAWAGRAVPTKEVFAIYTRPTAQSIPNNTDTIIDFDNMVLDTHSAVTTGASWVFTAPFYGIYRVDYVVGTEQSGNGTRYSFVAKNGTLIGGFTAATAGFGGTDLFMNCSGMVHLDAGDTLSVSLYQSSGVSLGTPTTAGIGEPTISISLVSPYY